MNKEVILTGLRSNSAFHLGNYLGAIAPMVNLQQKYGDTHQINMFVPDLHSFTTPVDHESLYKQTIDNLKIYVAAGLDINNPSTFIYRQSFIPAHSELTWILGCFTYFGELKRMTQFKDKSSQLENGKNEESVSAALFNYPVLMAADILLYDAKWVPVGDDQKQHLELTRDVAIRFNNRFGEIFTVPHEWNKQLELADKKSGTRIRSLKNPDRKMSKSIEDPAGTIMLTDNPEDAAKKVMAATTDSENNIKYDWDAQPGITNLLEIQNLLTNQIEGRQLRQWSGKEGYAELKSEVANLVKEFLQNIQSKLNDVDESNLLTKLVNDETIMSNQANTKLQTVQKVVGLRE